VCVCVCVCVCVHGDEGTCYPGQQGGALYLMLPVAQRKKRHEAVRHITLVCVSIYIYI